MSNEENLFYVLRGKKGDKLTVYHKMSGTGPALEVSENIRYSYTALYHLRGKIKDYLTSAGFNVKEVGPVLVRCERPGYIQSFFEVDFECPNLNTDELIQAVLVSGLAKLGTHVDADKFPKPSIESFKHLAKDFPYDLERWLDSGLLNLAQLSLALEEVKGIEDIDHAVRILLQFSNNPQPLVREGAIYGLADFTYIKEVRERLTEISKTDDNEWLRKSALEALEG